MSGLTTPRSRRRYIEAAHFDLLPAGRHAGIVLMHGLGGDLEQPRDYTAGVVEGRQATRLLADAREHGDTHVDDPGRLSFRVLADDISGLADAIELPAPRVLIGVSMGAGTALRAALDSQAGLRALVLIRPAWLDQPGPANLAAFPMIADLLQQYGSTEGGRRFAEHPLYRQIRRESESTAASLLEQFIKPWALQRARRLIEMPASTPFDSMSELEKIRIPTLVVGAPSDPVHPLPIARAWSDAIPDAKYCMITARDISLDRNRRDLRLMVDAFLAGL